MGPEEASADARAFARVCRDWFVSLVAEGFTKDEATTIIAKIIGMGARGNE